MPGQFVHMSLVNSVCTPEGLAQVTGLTPTLRSALRNYTPFCRLGAASPDCPSLVGSTDATGWCDVMHYVRPADFIRYAIPKLLQMRFSTAKARACIAWVFGYTSHVVADCTIHPVVEALVGPYSNKKNRAAHRRCELDQDAYLFRALTGHEVLDTDFLRFTGLAKCGVRRDTNKLNPAVVDLWATCLGKYPRDDTRQYVRLPGRSLTPNVWYATYCNIMEHFATSDGPFVRWLGCAYRKSTEVDRRFIENLPVPRSSAPMSYTDLFEKTRQNLVAVWSELARALRDDDARLFTLRNANLDTGEDASKQLVFW